MSLGLSPPLLLLAVTLVFSSLCFSQVTVTATLTDGTGTTYRTAYLQVGCSVCRPEHDIQAYFGVPLTFISVVIGIIARQRACVPHLKIRIAPALTLE